MSPHVVEKDVDAAPDAQGEIYDSESAAATTGSSLARAE